MTPIDAQDVVTRFAPSPTGRLHLGHAYSALAAHDLAREHGGRFLLRIEDIDVERCRPAFLDGILEDLRWLGLPWDALTIQSMRAGAHAAALQQLRSNGLLYPCICTRSEIAASASAPHGPVTVYAGTCRDRSLDPGDPHPFAWRLDVGRAAARLGRLDWQDADAGTVRADPETGGDIVVGRKGLGVAYHLAVVIDDAAAGVTDVVRGDDLFAATHVQRLLQALLDLPTPRYRHHPLVLGPDGRRLAKRTPGTTLADMRAARVDPHALIEGLRRNCLPVGFTVANA